MRRFVAVSLLSALVVACSGAAPTPEERVRAVLAELEAAAEAREVGAIKPHISESYKDDDGNDRRALLGLATAHFMRNKSVYLLVRVNGIQLAEPGAAQVDAFVALAGQPIRDPTALTGLRADLYRFDVRLRDEDGEWRVSAADWRPAALSDFQ